jgi:hypothetical protein
LNVLGRFLLAHGEEKAGFKLRIGLFPAFSFFLFFFRLFFISSIGDALFFTGIDIPIFVSRFFVVNVLGFVGNKRDSMLSPELFDIFGFLIFLEASGFEFGRIFGTTSFSSLT